MQVKRELEEERQVAEEEARRAQQAIEAKQAELAQIEAARKQEVRLTLLTNFLFLGVCILHFSGSGTARKRKGAPQNTKARLDCIENLQLTSLWSVKAF